MYAPYPVIFCIGTPRVQGDSLGPKVGDLLQKVYNVPAYVYGTSHLPVTGVNFKSYLSHVRSFHPGATLIAVDACLGSKMDIGTVKCTKDGLRAGSALKKQLGTVGDIGFLGIVAERGEDNFLNLSRTEEKIVNETALLIADKVYRLCAKIDVFRHEKQMQLSNAEQG